MAGHCPMIGEARTAPLDPPTSYDRQVEISSQLLDHLCLSVPHRLEDDADAEVFNIRMSIYFLHWKHVRHTASLSTLEINNTNNETVEDGRSCRSVRVSRDPLPTPSLTVCPRATRKITSSGVSLPAGLLN